MYFRVSSDRRTTESQFDELIETARAGDHARDLVRIHVITTVYELADLGITMVSLRSQTGPVNTAMGRLLWAIQGWHAGMENEERSENGRGEARGLTAAGRKQLAAESSDWARLSGAITRVITGTFGSLVVAAGEQNRVYHC